MAESTKIEWADATFNPWVGCTKVSPGCDQCYAETLANRYWPGRWGPGVERKIMSEAYWKQPLAWDRKAEREGRKLRVFCASMADVFDAEVPDHWRDRLFDLIDETPNLTWMILTKRPKVMCDYVVDYLGDREPLPNVWLGVSVENQAMADLRIPLLLETPAAKRFLSCEPLLGLVDLIDITWPPNHVRFPESDDISDSFSALHVINGRRIDWVICGGESGRQARPMHPDWARSLRDQCVAAGVPFFFKQWGEWRPFDNGGPDERVDDESNVADSIFAGAVRPAFLTSAGNFIARRRDLPVGVPAMLIERVGKKAAGRLLDGREWSEVPA